MAVVEYMMHLSNGGNNKEVPGFIKDRGHHFNPADNTFIGWVEDERDYYVPDSIVTLTKEQFIDRQLAMHAESPMMKISENPVDELVAMTTDEVRASSGEWYDNFVAENS